MYVDLLDDDFAAVEPLAARVVEVVLRDDDGQDGHASILEIQCYLRSKLNLTLMVENDLK